MSHHHFLFFHLRSRYSLVYQLMDQNECIVCAVLLAGFDTDTAEHQQHFRKMSNNMLPPCFLNFNVLSHSDNLTSWMISASTVG